MPKYLIACDSGFCGVNEKFVVEADDESTAEETALERWTEECALSANVEREIPEDDEEIDWYEEIT